MDGADALTGGQWHLAVALGIGLLLGLERERRKGVGPGREAAGIRTFALVALLGGLSVEFGGVVVLAVAGAFVGLAALVAYAVRDHEDPGLTTEVALMIAFLLGALTGRDAALAAGLAVLVTALLAARAPLHRMVRDSLSPQEIHDALVFAAAALVILPLVPDRAMGPYGVFNPFAIWRLVVLVMGISATGYIALRLLGPRIGLALAGFAGGFVSSAATIGAMGARAREDARLMRPAVAGAVLSTLATVVQLAVVIGATSPATLRELALPLAAAGVAAGAYGAVFALRALSGDSPDEITRGRAFDLRSAVLFAGTVAVALVAAAALSDRLGDAGLAVGVALAGLADVHAAAISAAALVAAGNIAPQDAVVPVLGAITANTLTKAVLAVVAGRRRYALQVWPGLALVLAAAWAGALIGGLP